MCRILRLWLWAVSVDDIREGRTPGFTPVMGGAQADAGQRVHTSYVGDEPVRFYKVQQGDTIADMARALYGSNSRFNRNRVRLQQHTPGSLIHSRDW